MNTTQVTATVRTVELESGTHLFRKPVRTVETREFEVEVFLFPTGTVNGGYTVSLTEVEKRLRKAGHLPPLDCDHEYYVGVKN